MTEILEADDVITRAGIYRLDMAAYHADPVRDGSLSRSGAKLLLPPSCPAKYRHALVNEPDPTTAMELGQAAHHVVLGDGVELEVVDSDEWRTKAIKAQVAEIRARGGVPLRPREWDQVQAMATALRDHAGARRLLVETPGDNEVTLIWKDYTSGYPVWRRSRPDRLPEVPSKGRMIIPEYKTAKSAAGKDFARSAPGFGYDMQAAWTIDAAKALLGLADDPALVFVVQEKEPPYLVNLVELDQEATRIGRARNLAAMAIYAECRTSGYWPGYGTEVDYVSLPGWFVNEWEEIAL